VVAHPTGACDGLPGGIPVFNFLVEVNRMLGRKVLLNLITGRYHRPRLGERVFLFIDIGARPV
jgi:hypothetical protein